MNAMKEPAARGRFEELDAEECWELIAAEPVGRVAFCTSDGPQVFPVNYSVVDRTVLFRTAAYNTMAMHLHDATAAFEIDEFDDFLESGWSVLLVGTADFVEEPELDELHGSAPEPWAAAERQLLVRIRPHRVTGRRVHPA